MDLVIFGIGRLARLMHFYFLHDSEQRVAAFTVHREFLLEPVFQGLPVVPFEEVEQHYPPAEHGMFLALGYRAMRLRQKMFGLAKEKGYTLPNYVSRRATCLEPTPSWGENNLVMPGAQVEPFASMGDNNLLWCGSLVSHEAKLGSHNYFSANTVVGGGCRIGDLCFVGNAAALINDVVLADETQVLPGTVIYEDTEPHTKYLGIPARAVGRHTECGIEIGR